MEQLIIKEYNYIHLHHNYGHFIVFENVGII